ncbi:regulatory protein RecX [Aeromicrobium sp. Leaf350]|uniref:regulatory protein RecX n=1 Tax=Aeromicrobium sp. Leaf350 TaxID=2876565 RepID=UPI001E5A9DC1|nr:regulatory protein RecX [Aeromicrobium sp. Leaf350]
MTTHSGDEPAREPAEDYALAKQVLYDRLAERPRSRADLEQALAKKRVSAEVAAAVLDRFESAGLIDDAAFARSWVEGRQRGKGLAARALAMELRQKGIADDIARDALAEIDPDAERQAAHRLVQTKMRSMAGLDPQVQTRRLVGMLARKGYPPGLAFEVVRTELGAEAEPLESM